MEKYRQKRSDKGKKRTGYKHKISGNYHQLIASANRTGLKISLTTNEYAEIRDKKCVFCGSGRNITVIVKERSEGISIDNVAPCCGPCRAFVGRLSFDSFIEQINKISNYLNKSGNVPVSGGEYESNFARYERDKNNFDEA